MSIFDGLYWVHWTPEAVTERSIHELIENIYIQSPKIRGIFVKCFNGNAFNGDIENNPVDNMSIRSVEDIIRWRKLCEAFDLEFHAWGVVKRATKEQIDIIKLVAAAADSIILDVEPYENYFPDMSLWGAKYLTRELTVLKQSWIDLQLGLCYDYRRARNAIHLDEWLSVCDSYHPMAYHQHFGITPQELVVYPEGHEKSVTLLRLLETQLGVGTDRIVPMLQAYETVENSGYDPAELTEIISNLYHYGFKAFSLFRYNKVSGFQRYVKAAIASSPTTTRGSSNPADESNRRVVSYTQISTFQSCPKKWQYGYINKIQKTGFERGPRDVGQLVHIGINTALYYLWEAETQAPLVEQDDVIAFQEAQKAMASWIKVNSGSPTITLDINDEIVTLADPGDSELIEMYDNACQVLSKILIYLDIRSKYQIVSYKGKPLLEYELEERIGDDYPVYLRGILDAVLQDRRTGEVSVYDWKIRRSFPNQDSEDMNPQLAIYQYMLQKHTNGAICSHIGVIMNVKSAPPKSPKFNQNGQLNKNYAKFEWVRAIQVYRNAQVQAKFWETTQEWADTLALAYIALDIQDDTGYNAHRALGWQCGHCDFRALCHAYLYGQDENFIMDEMYQEKERR